MHWVLVGWYLDAATPPRAMSDEEQTLAEKHKQDFLERGMRPVKSNFSKGQIVRGYMFNHSLEEKHLEHRLDAKEATSHAVGLVTYAVIGIADQLVESVFYLVGELTNDATFGTSRVIYRAIDGWNKGKRGTSRE